MTTFAQIEQNIKNSPALEDFPDGRDFQFEEIAGAVELPEEFSLRDHMTPVRNQLKRGTCNSHAIAGIAEYYNAEEHNEPYLNLSEEYVNKRIKQIDVEDYGYEGYGSYARSGAKAYQQYGLCSELSLPYQGDEKEDYWKQVAISQEMDQEASKYKCASYVSVPKDIGLLKNAIYQTGPVFIRMTLYEGYRKAKDTGIIPFVEEGEKEIGGHFIVAVGWKMIDGKEHLECKNSWGDWGDQGYLWIPVDFPYLSSFWAFTDALDTEKSSISLRLRNRALIPKEWGPEAVSAWDAAERAGLITDHTKPMDQLTKLEYFIFLLREGRIS